MDQIPAFTIPYGDTPSLTINYTVSGQPADLTGVTIVLTAKGDLSVNTPYIFQKTASGVAPLANGVAVVQFTTQDTTQTPGLYNYDFKVTDAHGNVRHTTPGVMEIEPVVGL